MDLKFNKLYFLVFTLIFIGCSSTKPRLNHVLNEPNSNFTLYVSNQSFEKPVIDISISIDGHTIAKDSFHVENQHCWNVYSFNLQKGFHIIEAEAGNGSYKLKEKFNIQEQKWAIISFWYRKENQSVGPNLSFEISNQPFLFI